ncbi:MAG: hypothetical protein PF542_03190 [Nanoarchaeota archaeon]|jgi:hypothetical protein|nr:hypothetical protein [Nanoarchaeota archaeon]
MGLEVTLDTGAMHSEVIVNAEKDIFRKTVFAISNSPLKEIEKKVFHKFIKQAPMNYHRAFAKEGSDYLKREAWTSYYWAREGIPTLNFEGISDNSISWKYIKNSKSVRQFLDKKDSMSLFDNFLDVYNTIRKVAHKKRDPMYLHSDPHLKNFLVEGHSKVIPIDSGCLLNRNLSLEELDFHLLKQTMMSISDLNTSDETKVKYIKKFNETFNDKVRESFLNWDYSISSVARSYLALREVAASAIKGRARNEVFEDYDKFVSFFDSNVRSILEK